MFAVRLLRVLRLVAGFEDPSLSDRYPFEKFRLCGALAFSRKYPSSAFVDGSLAVVEAFELGGIGQTNWSPKRGTYFFIVRRPRSRHLRQDP